MVNSKREIENGWIKFAETLKLAERDIKLIKKISKINTKITSDSN